MSMPSHYEINVSWNGKHLFATAPRSATTEEQFTKLYSLLKRQFPAREGYAVTATHWNCTGRIIEE